VMRCSMGLKVYDISSLGIMFQDAHQLMR